MHTKEEIDQWLNATGKTRAWLAEQCGVSTGRVYIWFSKNGNIPKKAMIIIDNLMDGKETRTELTGICNQTLNLVLNLDAKTYGQFAAWAKDSGFEPTPDGIAKWAIQVASMVGKSGVDFPRNNSID